MKYIPIVIIAALVASPAASQQVPAPPADLAQAVGSDFALFTGGQRHFLESVQKLVTDYQHIKSENERLTKEIDGLKAAKASPPPVAMPGR